MTPKLQKLQGHNRVMLDANDYTYLQDYESSAMDCSCQRLNRDISKCRDLAQTRMGGACQAKSILMIGILAAATGLATLHLSGIDQTSVVIFSILMSSFVCGSAILIAGGFTADINACYKYLSDPELHMNVEFYSYHSNLKRKRRYNIHDKLFGAISFFFVCALSINGMNHHQVVLLWPAESHAQLQITPENSGRQSLRPQVQADLGREG